MTVTLVTGASGYLGRHLVAELRRRGRRVRAVVRDRARAERTGPHGSPALAGLVDEWAVGDVTDPAFVADVAADADAVVSALGVTTQKADPWVIDHGANLAVLESAERHGVSDFCFVNVIGADRCPARLTRAKTAFAHALEESPVRSQIVNPPGYFSDMVPVFEMARRGRAYLLDPDRRINPIHGADLAAACVDRLEAGRPGAWDVGGPDVFTWRELAECAFSVLARQPRVTVVPRAVVPPVERLLGLVDRRRADTLSFVTWGMLNDVLGEPVGVRRLRDFFAARAFVPDDPPSSS